MSTAVSGRHPATSPPAPPHGSHPAAPAPNRPAPPAAPPLRQRRPTWALWLGLLIIAVGAVGGAALFQAGQSSQSVVMVRSALTAGQRVTAAQLATATLPDSTPVRTVPANQLPSLVGRYATASLPAGALLTPEALTTTLVPADGQTITGIGVRSSQMPAAGLTAGDQVRVVVTTGTGAAQGTTTSSGGGAAVGSAWGGTVVTVGAANTSGVTTVDISLPTRQATEVAAAAGAGNIAIVLDRRG